MERLCLYIKWVYQSTGYLSNVKKQDLFEGNYARNDFDFHTEFAIFIPKKNSSFSHLSAFDCAIIELM